MPIRKAMLLAAGLGTRLRPLTDTLPKPLVPILGLSILERHLAALRAIGITDVMINLHHLGSVIREALGRGERWGMRLSFSEERPEILGTGGGLSKVREFFAGEDSFLLLNGDIFHEIPLVRIIQAYEDAGKPTAFLVLRPHSGDPKEGWIGADAQGRVLRVPEMPDVPSLGLTRFSFTGLHLLTPAIFEVLPPSGSFCILRVGYRALLERGLPVGSWVDPQSLWLDIGNPATYLEANWKALDARKASGIPASEAQAEAEASGVSASAAQAGAEALVVSASAAQAEAEALGVVGSVVIPPVWLGEGVKIGEGCRIGPYAVIGAGAEIGGGSRLERSVVWGKAIVAEKTEAKEAIFWGERRLDVQQAVGGKG